MELSQHLSLGSEAYLVGKGPSLDWVQLDDKIPQFAVNEAILKVPKALGVFCLDTTVIHKLMRLQVAGKLREDFYYFVKKGCFLKPKKIIWWNHGCPIGSGILGAWILAAGYGVKTIRFVGFDSIDGEATISDNLKLSGVESKNQDGYKVINRALLKTIRDEDITPVWEHRTKGQEL